MRSSSILLFVLGLVVVQCLFSLLYMQELPLSNEKLGLQRKPMSKHPSENAAKQKENPVADSLSPNINVVNRPSPPKVVHTESSASPSPSPSPYDEPQPGARELGFKAKEDPHVLHNGDHKVEVIIVPHSHCDAGWLKTFDQYYQDEVKHILSTVTKALKGNPHRKFSWVEVSFLDKWWADQSDSVKNDFRTLHKNQQIELLMGGWVSNDEATVTYMQCINQMTEGHRWLQRELGEQAIPRIGWQIDPFGLSQATATMFSQMCFDANAAWRVGGTNRRDYLEQKKLEFIWRGSDSLGPSSDLLLHLLPWSYATSDEFLFEKSKSLKVDNPKGLKNAAEKLVESWKIRSEAYPTNTLMWPWGHDFMFTNAHAMFDSMDKIIDFINNEPSYNINVRYGTPSEYFDILHEKEIAFPMLQQDFLPYGPTVINWWNGYYTSRPLLKEKCRYLDRIQRTAEFMYSWARSTNVKALDMSTWKNLFGKLEHVRHVQGIMQHHDAITGTMREHVLHDYDKMIHGAANACSDVIEAVALLLTTKPTTTAPSDVIFMEPNTIVSIPDIVDTPKYLLLHNSLPWERTEIFSVTVDTPLVQVFDIRRKTFIESSVLPPVPSFVEGQEQVNKAYRLYFEATVPPVGYGTFILYYSPARLFDDVEIYGDINSDTLWKPKVDRTKFPGMREHSSIPDNERYIENNEIRVEFDSKGSLQRVIRKGQEPFVFPNGTVVTETSMDIQKQYWTYKSDSAWDNHYTFKALDDGTVESTATATFYIIRTPLVQEVYQRVNSKMAQRVTLKKNQNQIQISDLIGPPDRGVNYIARYSTSMETDGHFYTDDSGLEIVQRSYNSSDIFSGNFYPMVYSSFIREEAYSHSPYHFGQLSIVTDRTHGITSTTRGSFDLMLHRNTLQSFGNGEKMEDWNSVEIVSWLLVTKEDNYNRQQIAMRRNFPLAGVYTDQLEDEIGGASMFSENYEFPASVFLMNFDYHTPDEEVIAMRVNNLRQKRIFEFYEEPQVNDGSISYADLQEDVSLTTALFNLNPSFEERSLSLNQKVEDCKRHHWHELSETTHPFRFGDSLLQQAGLASNGDITLPPLAIRSFFMTFNNKS